MTIGTVCGTIFSTINHPFYDNRKLLVVDETDSQRQPTGRYIIAVDSVGAGVGQCVLVMNEGNGARQVFADPQGPVRSAIVGIIDEVDEPGAG
ncbi:MAG: hypothetical protein JXQ75_17310 [Phycisphaerae bacterium]|nr:hypothetical protein [Phycisphaerae bacterium]